LNLGAPEVSFPAMQGTRPPTSGDDPSQPRVALIIAAFASIYVIWGSTYLAIRFAIESIPPLFMAGVRFLLAGVVLYAWMMVSSRERPTRRHWRGATIAGVSMLAAGNGGVVIAEQWVPSGVTAVLVACVPLWMVLFDFLFFSRSRPSGRAQVGLLVGFGGVAVLAGTPAVGVAGWRLVVGVALLLGGCASWAAGSLYLRKIESPSHPLLWVAMQMIMGGAALSLAAVVVGELPDVHPSQFTGRSLVALLYLIVFGSLIAYSAYVWLLRVATPARVGTYAYVNPVIALFLGWALADEPIGLGSILGASIILGSVVVIVSERRTAGIRGVGKVHGEELQPAGEGGGEP
jgi:drug/metabolite transporter (DMT)-like permease